MSESCTPPEMREIAESVADKLLPEKSKTLYMKAYVTFKNWCTARSVVIISENVLLAYFQSYANDKKASTLWAHYSMLKSTLSLKDNIDISKFFKLVAFLKRQNVNYRAKKSSVFSQEEITKFLINAPDECHIVNKAILIIGLSGACRCDELCNLLLSDVITKDDMIIINIRNSKNGSSRKFVVMEPLWMKIVKTYLKIRSTSDMQKLFISIRNGKATKQNIGHNTIGQVPNKIAMYLNLQNPASYTGHSFRRTSATILAASGGNILQLKQHGGWKSSTVAEGYIADSLSVKTSIARMVQSQSTSINQHVDASSTPPIPVQSGSTIEDSSTPLIPVQSGSTIEDSSTPPVPVQSSSTIEEGHIINNSVINVPTSSSSLNVGGMNISMECHNCNINYNFYK